MKKPIRILAACLCFALLLSLVPVQALAAGNSPEKEEVVYVNLLPSGTVSEVTVVNIFEFGQSGSLLDYGDYDSVQNMTGTEPLNADNGVVSGAISPGKLYYQGSLNNAEIPWDISIHYYMNGKEYSAEQLAGMSGSLKISIDIAENTAFDGDFYDRYALQCTLSLDTDQCRNIKTAGATMANVGSNKQLTYTILPGRGAELEITADVTDFYMDAITLNGILLNLSLDISDKDLMGQVNSLISAIAKVDDGTGRLMSGLDQLNQSASSRLRGGVTALLNGANQLHAGASALQTGGTALQDGAEALQSGVAQLEESAGTLHTGILNMQTALNTLQQESGTLTGGSTQFKAALTQLQTATNGVSVSAKDLSALTNTSAQISSGIASLVSNLNSIQQSISFSGFKSAMAANGLDVDSLQNQNTSAAASLQSMTGELNAQIAQLREAGADTSQLEAQVANLSSMAGLFAANNACIAGMDTYLSNISANLSAVLQGATQLQTEYRRFDGAIGSLADQLAGLLYQVSSLQTAVNALVEEYEKLDSGTAAYADGVSKVVASYQEIVTGSAALVSGTGTLKDGSAALYHNTAELLDGVVALYEGSGTLRDSTGALDDGVTELLFGIAQLYQGSATLKDGTLTMRTRTAGLDKDISAQIDSLLGSVSGEKTAPASFVSPRNTNVRSVQFVMKTEPIQKNESVQAAAQEEASASFWDRLLQLFGQ